MTQVFFLFLASFLNFGCSFNSFNLGRFNYATKRYVLNLKYAGSSKLDMVSTQIGADESPRLKRARLRLAEGL